MDVRSRRHGRIMPIKQVIRAESRGETSSTKKLIRTLEWTFNSKTYTSFKPSIGSTDSGLNLNPPNLQWRAYPNASLLGLPVELRLQIYEHLIELFREEEEKHARRHRDGFSAGSVHGLYNDQTMARLSLLLPTSRQIFAELVPFIYGAAVLVFPFPMLTSYALTKLNNSFLPTYAFEHIREVCLHCKAADIWYGSSRQPIPNHCVEDAMKLITFRLEQLEVIGICFEIDLASRNVRKAHDVWRDCILALTCLAPSRCKFTVEIRNYSTLHDEDPVGQLTGIIVEGARAEGREVKVLEHCIDISSGKTS